MLLHSGLKTFKSRMRPVVRGLVAVVGLLIAGAAYVVQTDGAVGVKVCNVTEISASDTPTHCVWAHVFLAGHGTETVTKVANGRCPRPGEFALGETICHLRNQRLYLGAPWDQTGTVVLLSLVSAICFLVAGADCRGV